MEALAEQELSDSRSASFHIPAALLQPSSSIATSCNVRTNLICTVFLNTTRWIQEFCFKKIEENNSQPFMLNTNKKTN
jgi:hypothetical protein